MFSTSTPSRKIVCFTLFSLFAISLCSWQVQAQNRIRAGRQFPRNNSPVLATGKPVRAQNNNPNLPNNSLNAGRVGPGAGSFQPLPRNAPGSFQPMGTGRPVPASGNNPNFPGNNPMLGTGGHPGFGTGGHPGFGAGGNRGAVGNGVGRGLSRKR